MKRLILLVSGKVQQAGYRNKIVEFGSSLGLRGYAENLLDGRVKVVAEGEERKLKILKEIANIKNVLINVEKIEDCFGEATGEFSGFFKLVREGETDERLDKAAELIKELVEVNRSGFSLLKADTSAMLERQDITINILERVQGDTSDMKSTLSRIELDVKDTKFSLSAFIEEKYRKMEGEIAEIKATLARMQSAG